MCPSHPGPFDAPARLWPGSPSTGRPAPRRLHPIRGAPPDALDQRPRYRRVVSDATIKRICDFEPIGPGFTKARAELGITSMGMQVVDLPPGFERYPTHDHVADGQEEVYVVLAGGGTLVIDGEPHEINSEVLARVGPGVRRKLVAGPEGLRVLALGGIPGTFEAKPYTELSAPPADPGGGADPGTTPDQGTSQDVGVRQ